MLVCHGPRLKCAGASALDALDSLQKLYADHPVWQKGKQHLRGEQMVVVLWEGQASSGGSVSV